MEGAAGGPGERARRVAGEQPSAPLAAAPDPGDRLEQRLGIGMARRAEELVPRRQLDDAAEIHDGDAVGEVVDHREVVADEEIGEPPSLLERLHQIEDLALDRDVERRERLVGDDELGLDRERPGDGDALALPAGELMGIAVERIDRQPDLLHQRPRFRRARGGAADPMNGQRLDDDARDRHARIERRERILEHRLDGPPRIGPAARRAAW